MNPVEEFLKSQKRYRCEALSADLTHEQCAVNRKRAVNQEIFACIGCAGLGKAIELKERVAMESKCECGSKAVVKGKCWPCYDKMKSAERRARKVSVDPPADPVKRPSILQEIKDIVAGTSEDSGVVVTAALDRKANPLLPTLPEHHFLLDLSDKPELFAWLAAKEITIDMIIELLSECYRGNVRKVS